MMQFVRLKQLMGQFTVFSLDDIRFIEPGFHRRRLNEWQAKGYIIKIAKGRYIFSDLSVDEHVLAEIANRIYRPSYISLESALAYHQLIPESVYTITSISTRRTYEFRTVLGSFTYRTVNNPLFFGYEIITHNSNTYKIAMVEKAVLDFLYLNPHLKSAVDFAAIRFDTELLRRKVRKRRLQAYVRRFDQKTLTSRVLAFLEFVDRVHRE